MQKQFTLERTYDAYVTIEIVKRTNGKYYAEIDRNLDDLWQENDEYECWIDEPDNLMTEENLTEEEYDAIIETFRKEYPSIITVISQPNGGIGCARNKGIAAVSGFY